MAQQSWSRSSTHCELNCVSANLTHKTLDYIWYFTFLNRVWAYKIYWSLEVLLKPENWMLVSVPFFALALVSHLLLQFSWWHHRLLAALRRPIMVQHPCMKQYIHTTFSLFAHGSCDNHFFMRECSAGSQPLSALQGFMMPLSSVSLHLRRSASRCHAGPALQQLITSKLTSLRNTQAVDRLYYHPGWRHKNSPM